MYSQKKILLISDSVGYSRPKDKTYSIEDTFPYLLNSKMNNLILSKIIFGGELTKKLLIQAQSYYKEWNPDIIIVYSGINDCKDKYPLKYLLNYLPSLIKKRIVPDFIIYSKLFSFNYFKKLEFKRSINNFCRIFHDSKIYYNEISCSDKILDRFPSAKKNKIICNNILDDNKKIILIRNNDKLFELNGFCDDGFHLNKIGHKIVFDNICKKIS